jgi:hypothetical protein
MKSLSPVNNNATSYDPARGGVMQHFHRELNINTLFRFCPRFPSCGRRNSPLHVLVHFVAVTAGIDASKCKDGSACADNLCRSTSPTLVAALAHLARIRVKMRQRTNQWWYHVATCLPKGRIMGQSCSLASVDAVIQLTRRQ